jgi:hypothetical protein
MAEINCTQAAAVAADEVKPPAAAACFLNKPPKSAKLKSD